jgi:cytochrome c553
MPKHIARLILLIVAFGAIALFAKSYFTKDSFYQFGHYRGDSVAEIAAQVPAFQTPKACQSCHAPRVSEWSGANHKTVICEVCHGAAPGHPQTLKATIPTDTLRLCTQCHEKMAGRPLTSIRQIDSSAHHANASQCISCHNPHAPVILAAGFKPSVDAKAAAASAATCAACHGANGVAINDSWPNLAGQNSAFILRSIGSFKTGARKDANMSPMAEAVADGDVQVLAAYFSSMPCHAPSKRGAGNSVAGRELAKACTACHGENGRPVNTAWPRLAGQNPDYLAGALGAFKRGERSDPFMSPVAQGLSDANISDLATHFAGLACGASSSNEGQSK